MRAFEFRAWNKSEKRMHNNIETYGITQDIDENIPFSEILEWANYIVMQFTGIVDCKRTDKYPEGQQIYEGDIVKRTSMAPGGVDFMGKVVFDEGQFWIVNRENTDSVPLFDEIDIFEVIGNVFENSTLFGGFWEENSGDLYEI